MSLGPFDLTGGPFLALYLCLLVAVLVAGFVFPTRMRPSGRYREVGDADELAYLGGGAVRFSESVTARLLAARALVMEGRKRFDVGLRQAAASPAERSVIALDAPFRWSAIATALRPHAESVDRKLTAAGLLMTDRERADMRFWSTLPYAMLLTFGATKWIIGDMRDRPVGLLTVLLIVTLVFAALRWFRIDPRTEAGQEAFAEIKRTSRRLRGAPTTDEVGLAVAIYGTGVLVGSGWVDFHKLRHGEGGDGGGGGSSGDGGCGGGGCGGCGS